MTRTGSRRVISLADAIVEYGVRYSRERLLNLAKSGRFPRPVNARALRLMFVETEIAKWANARAERLSWRRDRAEAGK